MFFAADLGRKRASCPICHCVSACDPLKFVNRRARKMGHVTFEQRVFPGSL